MKNALLLLSILFLASCSSSDNQEPAPQMNEDEPKIVRILTRISIESSNGNKLDLNNGTTILTVKGFDQFDQPIVVAPAPQWSSNNTNVSVDQSGNVKAIEEGSSIVKATSGNIEASFSIAVVDNSMASTFEIFVSDAGNFDTPPWKILKYDGNGQNESIFIDQNLAWPQDIVFLEADGTVLISNLNSGNINRHDSLTGQFIDNFATGISGPTRMRIGDDNLLYVLQWSGNGRVLRYQLDGTFVDEFTSVGVSQSIGLDWDSVGNLYVSSFNGAFIRKFDTMGKEIEIFVDTNLQGPTDIWFDDNGILYVNDWSAGAVKRFNAQGDFLDNPITGLNQPEGIAFLPNGNFLIGNGGTGSVKRYTETGNYIEDMIVGGAGGLLTPNAIFIRELK